MNDIVQCCNRKLAGQIARPRLRFRQTLANFGRPLSDDQQLFAPLFTCLKTLFRELAWVFSKKLFSPQLPAIIISSSWLIKLMTALGLLLCSPVFSRFSSKLSWMSNTNIERSLLVFHEEANEISFKHSLIFQRKFTRTKKEFRRIAFASFLHNTLLRTHQNI